MTVEPQVCTSPRRGEVGAQRRVREPSLLRMARNPLTRRGLRRVDLSPPGRGERHVLLAESNA